MLIVNSSLEPSASSCSGKGESPECFCSCTAWFCVQMVRPTIRSISAHTVLQSGTEHLVWEN